MRIKINEEFMDWLEGMLINEVCGVKLEDGAEYFEGTITKDGENRFSFDLKDKSGLSEDMKGKSLTLVKLIERIGRFNIIEYWREE